MRTEIRILAPMLARPPIWIWKILWGENEIAWGLSTSKEDARSEAELARQAAEWRFHHRRYAR